MKINFAPPELVDIESIRPSTYNPRSADNERLDLIELSLSKLGFVLPIYADPNGEILSGHQRHLVATRMGLKQVPVSRTPEMDLETRRNVNVSFNRATNDLSASDTSSSITEVLTAQKDVVELSDALPGVEDMYPCMNHEMVPVADLVKANEGAWLDYALAMAKALARRKIFMPIVATRDLKVVNGIGRVQMLAAGKHEMAPVVFIHDDQAQFAQAMLNYLSMDFNLHERYADTLRHNSFRRVRGDREGRALGVGMTWPYGQIRNRSGFDIDNPKSYEFFEQFYGPRTLDFGAGRLEDVNQLRDFGLDADAFEPYTLKPRSDEIDPDFARKLTGEFLGKVAEGKEWNTIFLQAVMNSVPFAEDRDHIVAILAALCGVNTTIYAYSTFATANGSHNPHSFSKTRAKSIRFNLEYEDNIVLGEFNSKPKVQKFFTVDEFAALFFKRFAHVNAFRRGNYVMAIIREPKGLSRRALRKAIEFEFDMPYPDDTRMGLVDEALTAFSQRLGVSLTTGK